MKLQQPTKYIKMNRTFKSLLAKGIDSSVAQNIVDAEFNLSTLSSCSSSKLKILGVTDEIKNKIFDSRPPVPNEIIDNLLYKSRRTCCVCRETERSIIIHHIEEWSESKSNEESNLVVLCLLHHDEAHSKKELSQNLTTERIKAAKIKWEKEVLILDKEILENTNIDPETIKKSLNDLSSQSTVDAKRNQIKKWYDNFKIDSKLKNVLIVIIEHKQETILALEKKIKAESNSDYAKALKNLKSFLEKSDAEQIKDNYFKFTEQQKKENIELLIISIDASKQLFAFQEIIDLYEELTKMEPTAENYFSLGVYLQKLNYFDKALKNYEEALKIYREFAIENPKKYLPYVAMTLHNLALIQKARNKFYLALENYKEALKIYRKLAIENPKTYLPNIATSLNNIAILQMDENEFSKALGNYKEALKIRRKLAIENPKKYLPYVASTLNTLAILRKDQKYFNKALKIHKEALKIRRKLAIENPRAYSFDLSSTLTNLAILQKNQKHFEKALRNHEEALTIKRELAEKNPRIYLPHVAISLFNLAVLQHTENKFPQALSNYEEALRMSRGFAIENPKVYLPDVAKTLRNLAVLQHTKNKFPQALENYEEALKIYRELAKENPKVYSPYIPDILNNLEILP